MVKRMSVAVMVVIIAVLALAPAAMAAPQSPRDVNWREAPWQARWEPFPIWPVWGQAPKNGTGLQYWLDYSAETHELILTVHNPTRRPIKVSTPSGMQVDFALWRDGKVAYRASYGKVFTQALVQETFRAGQSKTYKEALPGELRQGTYLAQAYFIAETKWAPVASAYINLRPRVAKDPLEYSVEYIAPSLWSRSPKLRLTIKNTSDKDITLPYQYGYQVLVKKSGDRDYRGDVGIGQSIGTIEAGATRYVFIPLDALERGSYQVDVRSNVGSGYYRVVSQAWFYIW